MTLDEVAKWATDTLLEQGYTIEEVAEGVKEIIDKCPGLVAAAAAMLGGSTLNLGVG